MKFIDWFLLTSLCTIFAMSTTTSVGIVVLTPSLGCSAISVEISVGSIFFLSVDIFSDVAWDMPCFCKFAW